MKILFDINHPVDVNFFKNAIIYLYEKGFNIKVIYRPRGRLSKIIEYELGEFNPKPIGYHAKSFITKIISQIWRDFILIPYMFKEKFDLIVCFGPTSSIAAKIAQIPYLAFDDDFEYKIPFYHANLFATKHIYPDFIKYSSKNAVKYQGYKELAYLHPNYFSPRIEEIKNLGIIENGYVFIRHISNVSLNYKETNDTLFELLSILKSFKIKVLLSIEDKSLVCKIDSEVIILNEPIPDIYSLMYFAILAISYGDTVARECSLIGVPTVYVGGRDMLMHVELIQEGIMTSTQDLDEIKTLLSSDLINKKKKHTEIVSEKIKKDWCNTTQFILDQITEYTK